MKAKKIFITIDADSILGKFDYPQNIPLPQIGHTIIYEADRRRVFGKVYDVRHVITDTVVDITIKVREDNP